MVLRPGREPLIDVHGGEQASFDRCSRVTAAFGGTAMRIGNCPGSAAALDNALLSIYFSLFGLLNGAAICDVEGIQLDAFRDVGISPLPTFSGVLDRSVDMIASDSYVSEHSTLHTSWGAMSQIAAVVRDAGLDDRFIECLRTYAAEAIDAGRGTLGNAVLFEHLRRR